MKLAGRIAGAICAALALASVACAARPLPPRRVTVPAPAEGRVTVEFRLRAPDAESVSLVGTFNHWDPLANPMRREGGTWRVRVDLADGRHHYAFQVDGAVIAPPYAPRLVPDEFGGESGVVVIPHDLEGRNDA